MSELDVGVGGLEEPGRDAGSAGDDLVGGPRHHNRAEAHRAAGARSPTDGHAVGVPGDEAHLLEIDAQPLGQDLGEARLMPLAGRQCAEDELDPPLGVHGDLRALARRPAVQLDVVGEADAAVAAAPARLGPARLEPRPVGEGHGAVERRRVVPAVVDQAEGIAIRHGGRRHQVAPAQLDPVEAVTARGEVDQSLQDEHHLGPPGAAVGRRGGRVGEHGPAADGGGGHVVHASRHRDALAEGHEGDRV